MTHLHHILASVLSGEALTSFIHVLRRATRNVQHGTEIDVRCPYSASPSLAQSGQVLAIMSKKS
jgi:hypothetical protein